MYFHTFTINSSVIKKAKKKYFSKLGPGIITGASDDDPSGIATYSQAGAAFGYSTLWTALLTFPLMAVIQETCARIGMVTGKGLTGTLKQYYSPLVVYAMVVFSFPAIVFNIGADIAAMGAVSNMLIPSVHSGLFSIFYTALILFVIIRFPYRRIAAILKWLCMALFCYLIVPFFVHTDWKSIFFHTFIPTFSFNREFVGVFVGVLGTTISPYLFFWQTSMEVEEARGKKIVVDKHSINAMRTDINTGMFFSNLVMYFIILTTGAVLHKEGITNINTVDQAASALKPFLGNTAYLLFAIGILGTGFLAIPVLAGSLSYILAETFNWSEGLNKKYNEAKGFYRVIIISTVIALLINFIGISPIQSLIWTAILYGLTAPVLIFIILFVANNESIMGKYKNSTKSNIGGILTLVLMTVAAVALIYLQVM